MFMHYIKLALGYYITVTLHCGSNRELCTIYMCYTSMAWEALYLEDGTSQLDCLLDNSLAIAIGCNKMC